ncbi:MAG TPA: AAA family ATPase, partial [Actinomycetota bacterium]
MTRVRSWSIARLGREAILAPDTIFGRTDELSVVATFFGGEPTGVQGLLIEGDAGIGKSTVWREAIRHAAGRSRVLTSRASEAEARLSFAILGDLLVPSLDDEVLTRLPVGQRRGLEAALLLADPGQARPDPRAVGLAVLGILRALAERGPLTIAVDDVQWIDGPSARTLAFAVRRLETEPITLVAARRSGTGSRELLDLARLVPALERITLGSLDEASLGRLLRRSLARELPPPLVKKIHERTAGNPFFAIEVARVLGGRSLSLRPGDPLPIPRDLGEILHLRLSALSNDARNACILMAASPFPSRDVVEAAGGSMAGIREAIAEGTVGVQGARLEFTHPLLASTVYDSASADERRGAHARLAEVASDSEERARHLAMSASGPSEEVAEALDGAAAHARNRGAPLAAAELFELAATLTPPSSDLVLARRLQSASNLYDAGDAQGARDMVGGLLPRLDPTPARADTLRALAFMSWNDVHRVSELTTQALEEVGDQPDLRAKTLSEMAWAEFEACRPAAAAELAREALTLAEPLDDPVPERVALSILSTAEAVLGRPSEELIERGIALEDAAAPGETTWPAITHGRLLLWTGDLGAARSVLEGALASAIDQGREAATWEIRVHLAEVEHRAGRFERAARHANDALEIALDAGRESVSGEI